MPLRESGSWNSRFGVVELLAEYWADYAVTH